MKKPISINLLEKYLNGNCSDAEVLLVKEWYQSFKDEHDYVSGVDFIEEKEIEERIYHRIIENINLPADDSRDDDMPKIERSGYRSIGKWFAAAAVAAVFITVAYLVAYKPTKYNTEQAAAVTVEEINITNNTNQIYKSVLPDNSVVWLSPGANLRYPKSFAEKSRMVSMDGECFFEVTKNPLRPFIISSQSIVTKVWGTSFLVRDSYKSATADVSVVTGKVSVSIKRSAGVHNPALKLEKGEIMLYPHQKATYLADLNVLKPGTTIRERDLQLYTRVNLSFEGQPLRDIIPVLNTKFNVHIKVMNEKLNHFIFNADFAGFNLPDVLEALKKSINVNYEIKDDNTIELN